MVRHTSESNQATDYLSQISLGIKEKDLKNNPALVKKFISDWKEAKADNLALRDSLKAIQNAMETTNASNHRELEEVRTANHKLDKENAVLKAATTTRLGVSIIQDLTAAGIGGGVGALVAGQTLMGLYVGIPCLILYIICRVINYR